MSTEQLLQLIHDYQQAVQEAVQAFKDHLDMPHPMEWRNKGLPKSGHFGPGNMYTYAFHGPGCMFSQNGREVDFDFGYQGRTDGFDLWRLWHFVDERPKQYPELCNKERLAELFEQAEQSGLIHAPFRGQDDELYYLVESRA